MSVEKYSGRSGANTNDFENNCKCTWYSKCSYCKDLPRRSAQAEKDRMKAFKLTQNSQNYQNTLDKLEKMDLSGCKSVEINYNNSKKKGKIIFFSTFF